MPWPLWSLQRLQQLRVVLVPVHVLLLVGEQRGGRSSVGGPGSSGRPRWSSAGSTVAYTPAEVRALTPVRETVEKLVLQPERRDFFLCHAWDDRAGAAKELHDLLVPSQNEIIGFIRSNFRSVWSLETLFFLRTHRERAWSTAELVSGLRASDAIVTQSLDALIAGGLVATEEDGCARYRPASVELDQLVEGTQTHYAKSPDAVRRQIILSAQGGLTAFADAFKLRRD